jgi:hypothetical protein
MIRFNTEEACFEALGLDYNNLPDVSTFPEGDRENTTAEYVLKKVIKAHRGNWLPQPANSNQKKWFNYFWVKEDATNKSGFGFSHSITYYDHTFTYVGAPFYLPDEATAKHVRETFQHLYLAAYVGIIN